MHAAYRIGDIIGEAVERIINKAWGTQCVVHGDINNVKVSTKEGRREALIALVDTPTFFKMESHIKADMETIAPSKSFALTPWDLSEAV